MTAVVFDFAGVLFHWQPAAMLQRELPQRVGDAASAALWAERIFHGDWADFDRGSVDVPTLVQRIARSTGLTPTEAQTVIDAVPRELQPQPEVVALLRRLHGAGTRLFYLSNMPAPYADALESTHDFMRCFEAGVFSARVGLNKPEPAIYALAAQRFGVAPAQLLLIDDTAANVVAARAAGWTALRFVAAAQAERDLRAGGWL